MDATNPQPNGAPPAHERPARSEPAGSPWLGRSVAERMAWHARLRSRHPDRAIGRVVSGGRRFSAVVGRSLATRSALGVPSAISPPAVLAPASGPALAMVEPPERTQVGARRAAVLAASLAHDALERSPATARHSPNTAPSLAAGTLPRAALPPGEWGASGPGGFTARLRAEALPIRQIPDVAAVGPVLTPREARASKVATTPERSAARAPRPSLSSIARRAAARTEPQAPPPSQPDRPSSPGASFSGPSPSGTSSSGPLASGTSGALASGAWSSGASPRVAPPDRENLQPEAASPVPPLATHSSGPPPSASPARSSAASPAPFVSSPAVPSPVIRPAPSAQRGASIASRSGGVGDSATAMPDQPGPSEGRRANTLPAPAGDDGPSRRRPSGGRRRPSASSDTSDGTGWAMARGRETVTSSLLGAMDTRGAVLVAERLAAAPMRFSRPAQVASQIGERLAAGGPSWGFPGRHRRQGSATSSPGAPRPATAGLARTRHIMRTTSDPVVWPDTSTAGEGSSTSARPGRRLGEVSADRPGRRPEPPSSRAQPLAVDAPDAPAATPEAPHLVKAVRHLQTAVDGSAPPSLARAVVSGPRHLAALALTVSSGQEIPAGTAAAIGRPSLTRPVIGRRSTATARDAYSAGRPGGPSGARDLSERLPEAAGATVSAGRRDATVAPAMRPMDRPPGFPPAASRMPEASGTGGATRLASTGGAGDGPQGPSGGIGRTPRAQRFVAELARHTPDPVIALPPRLAPLARALGGAAPVELRAGPGSAAALAAAGRPAATVGRVVHLSRRPDTGPASAAVVAHELVHATRPRHDAARQHEPGPIPRFFHDDLFDHEEGLARTIGSLVKRMTASDAAPMVPPGKLGAVGGGTPGWVPARPRGEGSQGGRPPGTSRLGSTLGTPHSPGAGTPDAGAGPRLGAQRAGASGAAPDLERLRREEPGLAALLDRARAARSGSLGTGGSGGFSPGDLGAGHAGPFDRSGEPGWAGAGAAALFGREGSPAARGAGGSSGAGGSGGPGATPGLLPVPLHARPAPVPALISQLGKKGAPAVEPTPTTVQSSSAPSAAEILEWIVEHVEQRVLDELERRGQRHVPEVF